MTCKIAADGTVWVSCNARGCFLKVNPVTMEVTEIPFPLGGSTRRFVIAPDGMIWFNNSNRGGIGRYNPKTGEFKEWQSPSGRARILTARCGWTAPSGTTSSACGLIRWSVSIPSTETFQSWPIPVRRYLCRHPAQHAHDAGGQHPDPPVRRPTASSR